jgi:hypothetical protein
LEGLNEACDDAVSPELEQQEDCLVSSSDEPRYETNLTQLPLEEWTGLAVYTFVETDGASSSETMMVGWVKNVASSGGELPETVDVEARYHANIGYFASPQMFPLDPEDVFVVDENSETEEATVIKKLRAEGSAPTAVGQPKQNTVSLYHELAVAYAKSLGEGLKVLGDLPDGREVVWLSNDPSALYLAKSHRDDRLRAAFHHYAESIGQGMDTLPVSCPKLSVRAGGFCCPWGCSVQMNENNDARDGLSFDSVDDYRLHCDDCHSYGSAADMVELGDGKLFTRIHEGLEMLELSSGISSAIVARLPSVWPDAAKTPLSRMRLPSGTEFTQSPTREKLSLPWTNDSLRTRLSQKARQPENGHLLSLVELWSTIGHLFESEGSGLCRLSQTQFEATTAHHHISGANENGKPCHITNCCQFISPSTSPRRFLDCALCCLPWEKCIGKPTTSTSNMEESTPSGTGNDSRGLGCVLRSDASFERSNVSDEIAFPGIMGEAKALLLQVAELIPPGLKLSNAVDKIDPLEGRRIWDEAYLDVWKVFVRDCSTPSMFSQALTVLVGSINRRKMPRWWKQDGGGWSTSQMIMANTSMETFFLHLYVLDAALSETIGKSFLSQAPPGSISTSAEDRSSLLKSLGLQMARYMSFAQELGEPLYDGEHDEDCMVCYEGGDLLCCEFCDGVAHAKCLEPPLKEEEANKLENWVCGSCINDFCDRKGVLREDIERQYPMTETECASNDG